MIISRDLIFGLPLAPVPTLDPVKLNVWLYACVMLAADAGLIEMPFVPSDRLRDTLQAYFEAQIDHYDTVESLFGVRH